MSSQPQFVFPQVLTLEDPKAHRVPIKTAELRHLCDVWIADGFGPTGQRFQVNQREMIELLRFHLGQQNAIPIREIEKSTGWSEREVKQAVHDLRLTHHIKVGSSRAYKSVKGSPVELPPHGYFLILTDHELQATRSPYLRQALTSLKVADALTGGRAGLARSLARLEGEKQ